MLRQNSWYNINYPINGTGNLYFLTQNNKCHGQLISIKTRLVTNNVLV